MPGGHPCICTDLHGRPDASRGVVARAVRDRCDVFRGRAPVTTPDTRHNSMRDATLTATAVRERGLLNHAGMDARRRRARPFARARSAQGFSLIELLIVVAIIGVLAAIAIGVTPGIVNTTKGQAWRRSRCPRRSEARPRDGDQPPPQHRDRVHVAKGARASSGLEQIRRAARASRRSRPMFLEGRVEYQPFAAFPTRRTCSATPRPVRSAAAPGPVMFTSPKACSRTATATRSTRRSASGFPARSRPRTPSRSSAPPRPSAVSLGRLPVGQ